jgi:hypothetical protein
VDRTRPRGLCLGGLCLGSRFFSVHLVRLRRDRRGHRFVRENGVRCIRLGLRLRERVRWELVRERELARRLDRRVRALVLERRRAVLDNVMCRVG